VLEFKLLQRFEATFRGRVYKHRDSQLGNRIADFIVEDLFDIGHSKKFNERVTARSHVLNPKVQAPGIKARRGDESFGRLVPAESAIEKAGFNVARGPTANVEIGAEVKIVAKAMIKQIDRVITDLTNQAKEFKKKGGDKAITVGLVGVNHASVYTSYEGKDRVWKTDGTSKYRHPVQEAEAAKTLLRNQAVPAYDEFIFLEFDASNAEPFPFKWLNESATKREYAAALSRILDRYNDRF
jgi:hypothetical protein